MLLIVIRIHPVFLVGQRIMLSEWEEAGISQQPKFIQGVLELKHGTLFLGALRFGAWSHDADMRPT